MRALFWILLLGNALLFAVMLRGGWGGQEYQPQPPLFHEQIRLVDANQVVPVKVKSDPAADVVPSHEPLAASAPAPADATSAIPASAVDSAWSGNPVPATRQDQPVSQVQVFQSPAAGKQKKTVCLEWGEFSGTDLKRATQILSALQLGEKSSQRQIEYDKGYWVYIPPLKSRAAVNQKIAQLKKRRVNEYFIVWDKGSLQYAISLGVFKTRQGALNYLHELRAKDVRSAQVGERASRLKTTLFTLTEVDSSAAAKLAATQKDFPGIMLKNIDCTLTR